MGNNFRPHSNGRVTQFQRGDQIIYTPYHVEKNDINHREVEFGFVNSHEQGKHWAFVHFWNERPSTIKGKPTLRTESASQRVDVERLQLYKSTSQENVDEILKQRDEMLRTTP